MKGDGCAFCAADPRLLNVLPLPAQDQWLQVDPPAHAQDREAFWQRWRQQPIRSSRFASLGLTAFDRSEVGPHRLMAPDLLHDLALGTFHWQWLQLSSGLIITCCTATGCVKDVMLFCAKRNWATVFDQYLRQFSAYFTNGTNCEICIDLNLSACDACDREQQVSKYPVLYGGRMQEGNRPKVCWGSPRISVLGK